MRHSAHKTYRQASITLLILREYTKILKREHSNKARYYTRWYVKSTFKAKSSKSKTQQNTVFLDSKSCTGSEKIITREVEGL